MRRPSSIVKSAAKYVTRSLQHPAVAVIAIALVGVFATAPVWAGAFWVNTSNSITGRGFASVGDAANWWWNNDPAKNIPNRQFQFAGTISCLPQQPNVPPNAGHTGYCTSIKYTNSAPQAVTAIYWDPNTPSPPKNFSVAPSAPPPPIISNPGPVPTNQCATKPIVSNPINFGTGDKYQSETDYVGKSGLMFTRYYHSSQFVSAANLGSQWRHNYDRRITVFEDTVTHAVNFVIVTRGDGQQYQFTLQNGVWTPESDIVDQLTPLTTGGVSTGWQLATPAEEVETYDVQGKLVSIALRTGSLITFAYSNATTPLTIAPVAGLLISVMDPFGRQLNFTYDANQRLAKTIDPEGNVFAYSYDANDNLFVVSYPDLTPSDPLDNPKRTYVYDEQTNTNNTAQIHALTGIIDENNQRFATYAYDTQGRAISSEHAGGVDKATITYNSSTSSTVVDAIGTSRSCGLQTIQDVAKVMTQPCPSCGGTSAAQMSYDANGNVTAKTDFNGNKTTYQYDLTRNLETSRTEGLTSSSATTAQTRTIGHL